MSSRSRNVNSAARHGLRAIGLGALLLGTMTACGPARAATTLHEVSVCADPNNLPFSNREEQGFENRIAELVARDLHAKLRYVWWAQRRGFARNTLNARQSNGYLKSRDEKIIYIKE